MNCFPVSCKSIQHLYMSFYYLQVLSAAEEAVVYIINVEVVQNSFVQLLDYFEICVGILISLRLVCVGLSKR